MPYEAVLGKVYAALEARLQATPALVALLAPKPIGTGAGIYSEGDRPQAARMPYVTIGGGTANPWHTLGEPDMPRYGWNCTVLLKGSGQLPEAEGLAIMSEVAMAVREGTPLALDGYGSAWCDELEFMPTLIETAAAIVTRSWPVILRVYCHEVA
jgi:hypothetical protein